MTKCRTDSTSAFNTRTVGEDVSSFLIQQGKERLMEIQKHDGVVVDAAVTAAGLRRASARGRGVAGEREAPRLEVQLPSLPPLYRPPGGALALGDGISWGGAAAKGVECPPRQVEAPPP